MVVVCEVEEEVSGGEERGRKYLPLLPSRCCPNTPSGSTAGGSAVLPLSLSFLAHSRAAGSTGACPAVVPLARSPSARCTGTLLGHVSLTDWMGSPVPPLSLRRYYRWGISTAMGGKEIFSPPLLPSTHFFFLTIPHHQRRSELKSSRSPPSTNKRCCPLED